MLSSNAGIINEVYSDDNDNLAFSFNCEVKKYEVTENLVFFELVQNAFAQLRKDSIGSNGSKAYENFATTLKLQKKRSEESTSYYKLKNSWPKLP